jgi:hypothetical protein
MRTNTPIQNPSTKRDHKKNLDPYLKAVLQNMTHEDVFCKIFMISMSEKRGLGFLTIEEAKLLSSYYNDFSIKSTIKTFCEQMRMIQRSNNLTSSLHPKISDFMNEKEKKLLFSFVKDVRSKNANYFLNQLTNNNVGTKSTLDSLFKLDFEKEYSQSMCDPENLSFYFLFFSIVWATMCKKLLLEDKNIVHPNFSGPIFCKFHGVLTGGKRKRNTLDIQFETDEGIFFNICNVHYENYVEFIELMNGLRIGNSSKFNNTDFIEGDCLLIEFPNGVKKMVPDILKTTLFPFRSTTKKEFKKDKTLVYNIFASDWYIKENISRLSQAQQIQQTQQTI